MTTQAAETYDFLALEDRILDYFNFIRSTAFQFSGDANRAEDFAQETICKIIKAQPNHALLGPKYFKQATVSVIKDAWRAEGSEMKPSLLFTAEPPESMDYRFSPEKKAVVNDTLARVQAVCTQIEWDVIVMKSEGFSVREIGRELGLPKSVVQRAIERVIAKAKDKK
jgi:RNA polymerase sigma factor (sigma-70 family)